MTDVEPIFRDVSVRNIVAAFFLLTAILGCSPKSESIPEDAESMLAEIRASVEDRLTEQATKNRSSQASPSRELFGISLGSALSFPACDLEGDSVTQTCTDDHGRVRLRPEEVPDMLKDDYIRVEQSEDSGVHTIFAMLDQGLTTSVVTRLVSKFGKPDVRDPLLLPTIKVWRWTFKDMVLTYSNTFEEPFVMMKTMEQDLLDQKIMEEENAEREKIEAMKRSL